MGLERGTLDYLTGMWDRTAGLECAPGIRSCCLCTSSLRDVIHVKLEPRRSPLFILQAIKAGDKAGDEATWQVYFGRQYSSPAVQSHVPVK